MIRAVNRLHSWYRNYKFHGVHVMTFLMSRDLTHDLSLLHSITIKEGMYDNHLLVHCPRFTSENGCFVRDCRLCYCDL